MKRTLLTLLLLTGVAYAQKPDTTKTKRDTLVYTISHVNDYRPMFDRLEKLRKDLAIAGAYELAKEVDWFKAYMSQRAQVVVPEPPKANPVVGKKP